MFKAIGKVLKSKWFAAFVGIVFLSIVIWILGPMIGVGDSRPLDPEWIRIAVIAGLFAIWLLCLIIALLRARARNRRLASEIAKPAEGDAGIATSEELGVLKDKLTEALSTLKKAKLGGAAGSKSLYQLPWYIIVGPPGSGKTTALVNSGLKFPLAETFGKDAVRGVGGTRNCDWWFTDEAVLIDTAGRYLTQDSYKEVDRSVWSGFLGMLKRNRPRQPINGAMVAISLPDLATMSDLERAKHSETVRTRLQELHEALGIRFPIYVLFTKADLIAGFREYFDNLKKPEREQVWGFTLPLEADKGDQGPLAGFDEEFDLLVARLNEGLVERIHAEPDLERRGLIYGFPLQVAALRDIAREFLTDIFRPTRFAGRPMLRGVYLTSGTQEGTPIDRLMGALAASFGLDRQRLRSQNVSGRSYFLQRLLTDVIFKEANIVGTNRRVERRMAWLQGIALTAAVIVTIGMAGAWYWSYSSNRTLISEVQAASLDYEDKVRPVEQPTVDDTDFTRILPALNAAATMPTGFAWRDQPVPISTRLGLYQGGKLGDLTGRAYERALNALLLPRLILRLDQQVRAAPDQSELLYQALKVYLMLGAQGPLDTSLVRTWFAADWATSYAGNETARQQLTAHLDQLLQIPFTTIALNNQLVQEARTRLSGFPLPERAYRIVKDEAGQFNLPEWRPVDHGGPAVARVFTRLSGRPLSEGIDGLYTFNGFHSVFLPLLEVVAEQVAEESWVMGPQAQAALGAGETAQLRLDVANLYYNDFRSQWDQMLGDLAIVPFDNLTQAVQILNFLAAGDSPMRRIIQDIAHETALTNVPPEDAAADPAGSAAATTALTGAAARLPGGSALQRLQQMLNQTSAPAAAQEVPGKAVDDAYDSLQRLAGDATGSPLDLVIGKINDAYQELSRVDNALNSSAGLTQLVREGSAAGRLGDEATLQPEPVKGWILSIVQGIGRITAGGAQSAVNDQYKANILPICQDITNNRYPIFQGSSNDIALNDFTRLFAPGGLLDAFFNEQLASFVDTTATPWRWQRLDLSPDSLVQFERAAKIRDAFFPAGGSPQIRFDLTPVSLDVSATNVLVEIGEQPSPYAHGPIQPKTMQWPDPSGANVARVSFSPPLQGQQNSLGAQGPWALFRLLQQAQVQRTASDRLTITFTAGLRRAVYELSAGSVSNPFTMPELSQFRCPASL